MSSFSVFFIQTMCTVVLKNDNSSQTVRSIYKHVKPKYRTMYQMDCYENEKQWLTKLQGTDIVPELLLTVDDARVLVTKYAGEPVIASTLPDDWEQQRDHILVTLKTANCRHNDIKPSEILVQEGTIRLIDFGWASPLDQPIPKNYPTCLGCKWRCPTGLNDEYSFNKSVDSVLRDNSNSHNV